MSKIGRPKSEYPTTKTYYFLNQIPNARKRIILKLITHMISHLANSWKACPSVQFSWNVAPTLWVTNCPNLNLFCIHFCRASFFSILLFSFSNFFTTSIHLFMCNLCWSMVFCCCDNWWRSSSLVLFNSSILLLRTSRSDEVWVSNSCILWHVSSVWNEN